MYPRPTRSTPSPYTTLFRSWNNTHSPAAIRRGPFPHVRLWSENLREAGYELSYLGKWHVSHTRPPSEFGWEEGAADPRGQRSGGRKLENAKYYQRPGWPQLVRYGTIVSAEEDLADSGLTRRAIATIERGGSGGGGGDAPWCLYVGYASVGGAYAA